MTREEKNQVIDRLTEQLNGSNTIYLADIAGLNAEQTGNLRRLCFSREVKLEVVKNTLLQKAMDRSEKEFGELEDVLKGNTSMMIAEGANVPAKVIKDFLSKKKKADLEKPLLKGAYVSESVYIGHDNLEALVNIKSKEELIGDIVLLLQSPAKNVISALQSGGGKLAGIMKTLSERES